MLSWNRELSHADARLHRVGLVDDDDPASRRRRIRRPEGGARRTLPVAKHPLSRREGLVTAHITDDGENRVVGNEVLTVKRLEIRAGQRGERLLGAAAWKAIGMKTVHETI